MPAKQKTTKTTQKTTRKVTRARKKVVVEQKQPSSNFVEYLRLGESYTSLVLGIIAVIIATILLLSFIHTRQAEKQRPEAVPTVADSKSFAITPTITPVVTKALPATEAPKATQAPTAVPAKTAEPKPTYTNQSTIMQGKTYTVTAGDSLWTIAEKVYHNGYNWVDIAKANKLSDPNDIHVGNKLVLPQVTPQPTSVATVHTNDDNMSSTVAQPGKIVGTSYTIMHGDDLWDIAVRAYGDGYKWTKIAKANNLTNPSLIHVGNKLKIPRN